MSSMRGAYKAKLRELSTTASRRKSKGAERRNNRDLEINKRRQLSEDMSPVIEKHEPRVDSIKKRKVKGPNPDKADNVLERLKKWREEKKRHNEESKLQNKSKPTFKVCTLTRDSESKLYTANSKTKTAKEDKAVVKKAAPIQKSVNVPRKTTRGETNTVAPQKTVAVKEKSQARNVKNKLEVEPKKSVPVRSQLVKAKNPPLTSTTKPSLQRATKSSADLASKLTVAAAAKALNASPKKFLRATRASTLQKKDTTNAKNGVSAVKEVSKKKGKEAKKETEEPQVLEEPQPEMLPIVFKPEIVPKILNNFDFSRLNDETSDSGNNFSDNAAHGLSDEPNENTFNETFAGVPLKSKRKSTRRVSKMETNNENVTNSAAVVTNVDDDEDDNLIVFTPGLSRRRSVRRSTRLRRSMAAQNKPSDEGDLSEPPQAWQESLTPKLNPRNTRRSAAFSSATKRKFEGLNISGQNNNENLRKSLTLTPDLTNKSLGISQDMEADGFNSIKSLGSKNMPSILEQLDNPVADGNLSCDLEISPIEEDCDEIETGNNTKLSKRSSIRKSLVLGKVNNSINSNLVVADGKDETSAEQDMDTDDTPDTMSDADTQVPVIDFTSTPKSHSKTLHGSSGHKRKSLKLSCLASDVEGVSSPEKMSMETPNLKDRRSRGSRRSSKARQKTPARTPKSEKLDNNSSRTDLNKSGVENIPRCIASGHSSARKSTVVSVSDEGTAVGRNLELALAYTLEKQPPSAKASRILKELVIEKVEGERSFFEVSFDESKGSRNNSLHFPSASSEKSVDEVTQSTSTLPFTPRKSNELNGSSSGSNFSVTPKSVPRTRHSLASSTGFKQPGMPLSALRSGGRRRTEHTPSKTPRQMINILKKSPMIEMTRRRSRHASSPAPPKGQYFRDLVQIETDRLTGLCNSWDSYITQGAGLEEDVLGQIRCAVGKALLLIEQRFKQFSGLIDNYVYDTGEKKTTPTDLQGFWDMIYFQVEDVNNLFKELDELKESNWQTSKTQITVKAVTKKKPALQRSKSTTKKVKSNFAAFKLELLKKRAEASVEATTEDGENCQMVLA